MCGSGTCAVPVMVGHTSTWIRTEPHFGNFRMHKLSIAFDTIFDCYISLLHLFRWDDVGEFDVKASINYILTVTGQPKLTYVGHSMGSAVFFISMIKNPELNEKIEAMVSLRNTLTSGCSPSLSKLDDR